MYYMLIFFDKYIFQNALRGNFPEFTPINDQNVVDSVTLVKAKCQSQSCPANYKSSS